MTLTVAEDYGVLQQAIQPYAVLCDRPKKLSLRILKRRLCKFPSRSVSIDERLSGLTEQLTVIEDGDARGNGQHREQHPSSQPGLPWSHCSHDCVVPFLTLTNLVSFELKNKIEAIYIVLHQQCQSPRGHEHEQHQ